LHSVVTPLDVYVCVAINEYMQTEPVIAIDPT